MSTVAETAQTQARHDHRHGRAEPAGGGATDPVCGMIVTPPTKVGSVEHGGETYHFCSAGCGDKFVADPQKYVGAGEKAAGDGGGCCCGGGAPVPLGTPRTAGSAQAADAATTDPVCGMTVSPPTKAGSVEHGGTTYHFCSDGCRKKFAADPEKYLNPEAADVPPADPGAVYTCPMHPEVEQVGPGTCPICGMALEPKDAAVEADDGEYRDFRRRFWMSAVLTLPMLAWMVADMIPGRPLEGVISARAAQWAQLALSLPIVFWAALPFYHRGWQGARLLRPNMFTLIGVGVLVAFFYSVVATAAPDLFPAGFRGGHAPGAHATDGGAGVVGVYYESAAVIVTLVLLGQLLELRARARTGRAVRELLDLAPPTALRVTD